jgi:GntR family transcriptional regulator / MocR family aminotransferase
VSRGLVVACFDQLQAEGYVVLKAGSGATVAEHVAAAQAISITDTVDADRFDVDFEYGVPDLESFPRRDWGWALSQACRMGTVADLGDEVSGGAVQLRTVLASYGRRVRASVLDPVDVVVVPAFRHGLNVVLRCLAGEGVRRVGLEDPGPVDHDAIARRCGVEPVDVPVDEEGVDVAALAATDARVVVVTPAHQSPTGMLLSPRRRHELVEWARSVEGFIIEDDYDAEFRYDRQPVGSLQGLAPDRVIAMGSVSKTLAPTIRIGWIVVPQALRRGVLTERYLAGRGAPGLDQLALAVLIESGRFDRHLRQMRSLYGRRRRAMVDTLAAVAPNVVVTGLSAGCHAVLRLPAGCDEGDVVAQCAQRRVRLYTMGRYRRSVTAGNAPPQLVVGFGNVTEQNIVRGLTTVADVLDPGSTGTRNRVRTGSRRRTG